MTVYEFLKQAPPDIAALEIGRIVFGAFTSPIVKFEMDGKPEDQMAKVVAHVVHSLKREFDDHYYKTSLSKEIILKAKGIEKQKYKDTTTVAELMKALMSFIDRSKEKEDADGQQDHASAGQSDGDAAV